MDFFVDVSCFSRVVTQNKSFLMDHANLSEWCNFLYANRIDKNQPTRFWANCTSTSHLQWYLIGNLIFEVSESPRMPSDWKGSQIENGVVFFKNRLVEGFGVKYQKMCSCLLSSCGWRMAINPEVCWEILSTTHVGVPGLVASACKVPLISTSYYPEKLQKFPWKLIGLLRKSHLQRHLQRSSNIFFCESTHESTWFFSSKVSNAQRFNWRPLWRTLHSAKLCVLFEGDW